MKSIKVYAADEIIDDIKKRAKKLNMSGSGYMIGLHIKSVDNATHDTIFRGDRIYKLQPKKTIQEIRDEVDEKVHEMRDSSINSKIKPVTSLTGWTGGFSKEQQVGKK